MVWKRGSDVFKCEELTMWRNVGKGKSTSRQNNSVTTDPVVQKCEVSLGTDRMGQESD